MADLLTQTLEKKEDSLSRTLSEKKDPLLSYDQIDETMKLVSDFNIPPQQGMAFTAGPEPSAFGKALRSVREYIQEKTGLWEYDIGISGEKYREEKPLQTAVGMGAYYAGEYISGRTGTALDVLSSITKGDETFAKSLARIADFEPTPEEVQRGFALKYLGIFGPVGKGVKALSSLASRKALPSTVLRSIAENGLRFSSVRAAVEFSEKITKDDPIDWYGINLDGVIGLLLGLGEGLYLKGVEGGMESKIVSEWRRKFPATRNIPDKDMFNLAKSLVDSHKVKDGVMTLEYWDELHAENQYKFSEKLKNLAKKPDIFLLPEGKVVPEAAQKAASKVAKKSGIVTPEGNEWLTQIKDKINKGIPITAPEKVFIKEIAKDVQTEQVSEKLTESLTEGEMFHGSPKAGLTEIKPSGGDYGVGVYFTVGEKAAIEYSKGRKNIAAFVLGDTKVKPKAGTVYKIKPNLKNPLVIESTKHHNEIEDAALEAGFNIEKPDQAIADYARSLGYDGVINTLTGEGIVFTDKAIPIPQAQEGQVTLANYDEAVEPINQAMDNLETRLREEGLTAEQILEHPEMEVLREQRDKIDQSAIKQYSDIVHKAFEDAGIKDNSLIFNPMVGIASDIYYAPKNENITKFTPINTLYEVGQKAIENEEETLKKLAEKIFKYQAEAEGLDPEGILSPLSGLSKAEQKERLLEAARIAENIHNQIKTEIEKAQQPAPTAVDAGKQEGEKAIGKPTQKALGKGEIDRGEIKVEIEPKTKKVQTAKEIIDYIRKAFKVPIRGKATHHKKALGWYSPHSVGIRMKDVREITTATHEIAHHIDWALNNRLSNNPPTKQIAQELTKLGKALYGSKKPAGGYQSEGWAEFIREYLTGEEAQQKAPATYQWFIDEYLPKNKQIDKDLQTIKEMVDLWKLQGAESRIESQINKKNVRRSLGEWTKDTAIWLNVNFRDEFHAIKKSMEDVGIRQEDLKPGENPYQIAVARADKAGAVARHFVLEYTTDLAGNKNGKGLREILKPIHKDIKEFTRWAVAARAKLLISRGIKPGISEMDANYVYEKYDSAEWQNVLQEITEWNHRLLEYLSEAGGLDAESLLRIKNANPIYIPFMRAFSQGEIKDSAYGTGSGAAKTSKPVKKIKGSGREIIDPFESMIQQAQKIIGVAHKTQVARALASLATKKGTAGMIWKVPPPKEATKFEAEQIKKNIAAIAYKRMGVDIEDIAGSMLERWDEILTVYSNASHYYGKDNIVSLVIDGKRYFYEVAPELYRAMEGLDQYHLPWYIDMTFGKANRMVRLGATGLNASFGFVRNAIRDALTFTVLSKHAKLGPISSTAGIVKDVLKTTEAQKFKALGGKMASQILADRKALNNLKKESLASSIGNKTVYTVAHPIEALRELFGVTEAGTRIGEFAPALKDAEQKFGKGSVDAAIYALNQAQDVTTNFSRHGRIAKVLNQMIPFFNAAIQGPDKIVRTFAQRPAATTLKAIGGLTVPALLMWWVSKDEEWYENLSTYERVSFIHFRIPGTDTIVRIPVPFELGHIFQSAPVAVMDAQYRDKPELITEMFSEAVKQANPVDWPALISPVIDIIGNKDFAGRPIVPLGAEYKLPEDQYDNYTTELMKVIGGVIGQSPAKLEHLINTYSGGLYLRTTAAVEILNKKEITPSDLPILGTLFLRNVNAPSAQIEEFYNERERLTRKYNSDKKSLSRSENNRRKSLNRSAEKLSDLWKDLSVADTQDKRDRIYQKMKKEIYRRR